jgi:hypothetical protein
MRSSTVTVLRTRHPELLATKIHRLTAEGITTIPYGNPKTFTADIRNVSSIHELAALLEHLSTDPRAFVVRGGSKPGRDLGRINRRIHGDDADLMPYPDGVQWLKIDLDGLLMPITDAVSAENGRVTGILDPIGAVRSVIATYLPDYFQDVTVFYQFSSSAGIKPWSEVRLGLWYFLDRPIPDKALHDIWARQHMPMIDPAVYVTAIGETRDKERSLLLSLVEAPQGSRNDLLQ